ncbi:hypothetical protein [Luteimonas terrae]|uniref:hypothetical protein n=1 Tax=Luteimonas terrae TaxID=1530191 RepID=UPI001405447C|nr:hypothetical protein [Luteimonas terrae]
MPRSIQQPIRQRLLHVFRSVDVLHQHRRLQLEQVPLRVGTAVVLWMLSRMQ